MMVTNARRLLLACATALLLAGLATQTQAEPSLRVHTGVMSPLISGGGPIEPIPAFVVARQPVAASLQQGSSASTGVEVQGNAGALTYAFEPGSEVAGVSISQADGYISAGSSVEAGTYQTRIRVTDTSGRFVTTDWFNVTITAPLITRVSLSSGAYAEVTGWTAAPANITRYGSYSAGIQLYVTGSCGGFFMQLDNYGHSFGGATKCQVNGSFSPMWEQITGQSATPMLVRSNFRGTAGTAYTGSWSQR